MVIRQIGTGSLAQSALFPKKGGMKIKKLKKKEQKEPKEQEEKEEKKLKTPNYTKHVCTVQYNFLNFIFPTSQKLKIDQYSTASKPPIVALHSHSHLQGDSSPD